MQYVNARDRLSLIIDINLSLLMLKAIIFESIIKTFLRGLLDSNIRREITRGLVSSDRSLLDVYNLANKARRIKLVI